MEFKLNAEIREATGNQVGALRREGKVPAVVYGPGVQNRNLMLDYREIEKVYAQAGESTLVDLVVGDGKPVKVIVQDIQRDPLKNLLTHVDFLQVNMSEKMTASIALKFIGESPAVKALGALLVYNLDDIEVSCLPQDLVSHIDIDLSKLTEIGDSIKVGDITPPSGMEFMTEPDVSIVVANAPTSESEFETAPAAGEMPTVVGEKPAAEEGQTGEKKSE